MNKTSLKNLGELIRSIRSAAVFTHIRPDGDALGSGLALMLALKKEGIDACLVCEDVIPEKLKYLPHVNEIKSSYSQIRREVDAIICVDAAELDRIGDTSASYFSRFLGITINIDHHFTNTCYAKYNYGYECTATCELLPEILDAANLQIDKEVAECLLCGILTDSGRFSHSDVSKKTLAVASRLLECGADICRAQQILFESQPKSKALLFSKVMNSMEFYFDNKVAFITVRKSDFIETNSDKTLTEGLVNFPLSIIGVDVSASLMEDKTGYYRISLRSKNCDVSKVAGLVGGGGHIHASGCMVYGSLNEVKEKLLIAISQYL